MLKSIAKWFIKGDKLADYAATGFLKAINNSGKQEAIAKYGDIADKATDILKKLTEWLKDGKIDDIEKEQVKELLKPLFEKITEMI